MTSTAPEGALGLRRLHVVGLAFGGARPRRLDSFVHS